MLAKLSVQFLEILVIEEQIDRLRISVSFPCCHLPTRNPGNTISSTTYHFTSKHPSSYSEEPLIGMIGHRSAEIVPGIYMYI